MFLKKINFIIFFVVFTANLTKAESDFSKKQTSLYKHDLNYTYYVDTNDLAIISDAKQQKLQKAYLKTYFRAWGLHRATSSKRDSIYLLYNKKELYYQYNNIVPDFIWDLLKKQANIKDFGKLAKKAIVTNYTLMKALPTDASFYKDNNIAGEGYPFDYNQLSSLYVNTPIFVSHLSADKNWAFVENAYNVGWVKSKDISYIDKKQIKLLAKSKKYKMAIRDNLTLMHNDKAVVDVHLGSIFATKHNKAILAIRDNDSNESLAKLVYIDDNKYLKSFPLKFSKENIKTLTKELLDKSYGWGGANGRDCSMLTKDFLSSFGYPIQRNSKAQIHNGRYISLKNKSNKQKEKIIMQKGVPFLSLIYLHGHIGLYVGIKNNKPMMLHNIWALRVKKNGKEARYKIGKSIISTLEVGSNIDGFIKNKSLLSRVEGLIVLLR